MTSIEARFASLELKNAQLVQVASPTPGRVPTLAVEDDEEDALDMPKPPATTAMRQPAIQPTPEPIIVATPAQDKAESTLSLPHERIDVFPESANPAERSPTATHVFGRLKDSKNTPMAGVNVKIAGSNAKLVKSTRTSSSGEWLALLQPGEYTAEFAKPGISSFFKTITITPGLRKLEVK